MAVTPAGRLRGHGATLSPLQRASVSPVDTDEAMYFMCKSLKIAEKHSVVGTRCCPLSIKNART